MSERERISKKEYYRRLDSHLSFIDEQEGNFVDVETVFQGKERDLSERYTRRLHDDGYVEVNSSNGIRITLNGIIFLTEGGYSSLFRKERWEKIQKWIQFCLIVISGLGVIVTITLSYLNYSLTKNNYNDRFQKIEKKIDSLIKK